MAFAALKSAMFAPMIVANLLPAAQIPTYVNKLTSAFTKLLTAFDSALEVGRQSMVHLLDDHRLGLLHHHWLLWHRHLLELLRWHLLELLRWHLLELLFSCHWLHHNGLALCVLLLLFFGFHLAMSDIFYLILLLKIKFDKL